ncbi:TRAP transporter small permease [Ancylobacter oerskovii]|uniref:TRAP transporter small permease protein n=1 Tax=Ancylobacter oerskovii TaxID=459519 RepID=A0ABW4Z2J4_9HYPH|nr:TRAP transporter small permease [Ancylobacter oerskovii]MBS7544754.1 TRAP transporter small permease [Ancylobacter oerskovii]
MSSSDKSSAAAPSRGFPLGRLVEVMADYAAGLACGGILVVVLMQVVGRLIGHPLPWTEEAVRFLFIWMVFLGLAAGFRTVESARVVLFLAMMPRLSKRIAVPIYVVFSIGFFLLVGWTGITLVEQQIMMNEEAATLPIPMWVVGLVMPVSSVIAILAIVDSLRRRRDLIALPEMGLPPDEIVHADVSMTGGHHHVASPTVTGAHYQ